MLTKQYAKNNKTCKVTFELPVEAGLTKGTLVGDFNQWDVAAIPLKRRKDGFRVRSLPASSAKDWRPRRHVPLAAWVRRPRAAMPESCCGMWATKNTRQATRMLVTR